MKAERIGALSLSAAFMLTGTAPTAGKALAGILGPFTATAASLACALPALAPFMFARGRPSRRELLGTAVLAFFGIFLYRVFLVSALARVGAAEAGLMAGAAPALTAVAAALILGERMGAGRLVGVVATTAGIAAIGFGGAAPEGGPAEPGAVRALGLSLALGSAAAEALFMVLSRRMWRGDDGADARSRAGWTVAWALLFSAVPAAAEHPIRALASLPATGWAALAWYGLAVTAAAYVLAYEGIRRLEASRVAVLTGIVPVVGLAVPALLLGERPGAAELAGCALIAAGIAAAARPAARRLS